MEIKYLFLTLVSTVAASIFLLNYILKYAADNNYPEYQLTSDEWKSSTIFDSKLKCSPIIQGSAPINVKSNVSCQIPVLNAFSPSVMKFIKATSDPECSGKSYGELSEGILHFKDPNVVSANYRSISRNDDFSIKFSKSVPVQPNVAITNDFLEVDFLLKNGMHVKEFFLQVVPRENLLKRKAVKPGGIPLNILIIGIDSLSHASAKRKLPKIYEFLQDEVKGYIFNGHSVMGDGTTEQMTPLLTGLKYSEQYEGRAGFANAKPLDDWTWIYKELREHKDYEYVKSPNTRFGVEYPFKSHADLSLFVLDHGYVTGYSEDGVHPGPFHYRLKGFKEQPTDLYLRPFLHATKQHVHWKDLCLRNGKNVVQYQFDYTRSMFKMLPGIRKFMLSFSAGYSHDDINSVEKIQRDLLEHLKELKTAGYLNETLLMVMGDHGPRYGEFRQTVQGKLEERLPFLALAFPSWFKSRYPTLATNLRTNTERLTSWVDVYATFRHILSYPDLPSDLKHGQSLFTEISAARTCPTAAVSRHWCPCLSWLAVDTQHSHAQNAARATVEYMNSLNAKHNSSRACCRILHLKSVNYAMLEQPNEAVLRFKRLDSNRKTEYHEQFIMSRDCGYQIQFTTAPNDGIFESTVKYINKNFVVNTAVSRVDKYGEQPKCIANELPHLRKFCLCKNLTRLSRQ